MKLLKKLLRDRAGISIAEVAVSMAMVLIITGVAISLVAASIQSDAKIIAKHNTLTACENAVECVRFTTDAATLETAMDLAGFGAPIESKNDSGMTTYTYTFESGKDKIVVVVTYDTDDKFEKSVVNYNDDIIYTRNK